MKSDHHDIDYILSFEILYNSSGVLCCVSQRPAFMLPYTRLDHMCILYLYYIYIQFLVPSISILYNIYFANFVTIYSRDTVYMEYIYL